MKKTRFLFALVPLLAGLAVLGAQPAVGQDKGQKEEKPVEKPMPKPADKTGDKPVEAATKKDEIRVAATVGKPAPEFSLKDLDGKPVKLSDFKGKTVVLEWFNPECPVIVRCHKEGPLKDMATRTSSDGIVWLAINSGAPGMQGNGVDKNKKICGEWKITHPVLVDENGEVGKMYGAKTTPHMFVIDKAGVLAYQGDRKSVV